MSRSESSTPAIPMFLNTDQLHHTLSRNISHARFIPLHTLAKPPIVTVSANAKTKNTVPSLSSLPAASQFLKGRKVCPTVKFATQCVARPTDESAETACEGEISGMRTKGTGPIPIAKDLYRSTHKQGDQIEVRKERLRDEGKDADTCKGRRINIQTDPT
jgi:hypothetical protein